MLTEFVSTPSLLKWKPPPKENTLHFQSKKYVSLSKRQSFCLFTKQLEQKAITERN